MRLEVKVKDLVTKQLIRTTHGIEQGTMIGVRNSLRVVKEQANANLLSTTSDINPQSGRKTPEKKISQGWEYEEPTIKGIAIEGTLMNTSPHANYVEYGTGTRSDLGSRDVAAKGGKPLKFKVGPNQWVTKWAVAGQMPKAFLRNAIMTQKNNIPTIISDAIRSITGI